MSPVTYVRRRGRGIRRAVGVVAVIATTGFLAGAAGATPGDLDPTFGTGGLVTTAFPGWDASIEAVTTQPDGKIVAAGWVRESLAFPPPMSFVVARYNADGTLDPSFGASGIAMTKVGSSSAANAVAIQSDGKIVAAGFTWDWPTTFAVARFNPDGTLDATFGNGGKVITNVGYNSFINAVAIQADGKIVVGGGNGDWGDARNFIVTRYLTDGNLDATFGSGGTAYTNFFGRGGMARGLTIQPDGKIVEVGVTGLASYPFDALGLVRFNSDGTLDSSFGTGGKVTTGFGGGARGWDVVVQDDGRLVAVAEAFTNAAQRGFGLARYNTDGSPDTSFGTGGTTLDLGGSGVPYSVALREDGRIVVAGDVITPTYSGDFAVAQYHSDGSPDTSFGDGGRVATDFAGGSDAAHAATIQPDGNIVVAGGTYAYPTTTFALARYILLSDNTPPQITVPANMTVNATTPSGAIVEFTATATDENPANPAVTCTPPSGSVFAIGETTIVCTATDGAGNTGTANFTVMVTGAAEQLAALGDDVQGVGPGTSLADKVEQAQAALAANDVPEACSIVNAFINQVKAQSGKSIVPRTATTLIDDATRVSAVLDC